MQSPIAKILENFLCYNVYGLTSTRPFASVNPAAISSGCGLLGGLMTAVKKSFSIIYPVSVFLNTAIFSPCSDCFTLIISQPKKTSIPLFLHSCKATSFA